MKEKNLKSTIEEFSRHLDAGNFISRYRNYNKFSEFCRECPQFGKNWACPPFDFNIEEKLSGWENVLFHVSKIIPEESDIPIDMSRKLILPERIRLEEKFLIMERENDGLFLGFAGSCPRCEILGCTRPEKISCRFPKMCRPSMESFGFDLCKASEEIFGVELLWGKKFVPEYLTLVCCLFYNS